MAQNLNISQIVSNVTNQVGDVIGNLTSEIVDAFEEEANDFAHGNFSIFEGNIPTISFPDVYVSPIPECLLQFQFDRLELYAALDTILSGIVTYTLSLFKSKSPIGINADDEFEIGVSCMVELTLSVSAEVDIKSCFHILLKDGVTINLPMFSEKIHDITL